MEEDKENKKILSQRIIILEFLKELSIKIND